MKRCHNCDAQMHKGRFDLPHLDLVLKRMVHMPKAEEAMLYACSICRTEIEFLDSGPCFWAQPLRPA
jgi:hypothetical protein